MFLYIVPFFIGIEIVRGDFYSLETRFLLDGASSPSSFRTLFYGKAVLLVNSASECGYTDSHYRDLYRLQDILGDRYFRVIVYPCNDFGKQEPGSEKVIKDFIWWNYGDVPFLVGEKLSILDKETRHPIYQFIQDSTSSLPDWNFYKYLIDHNGKVIGTFPHYQSVSAIFDNVHKAVKEAKNAGKKDKSLFKDEF
ncbi:gpx [Lepeophtheirus salmonis]|uniref:Glutathione peroxidase n=1 Tax=Lepeophtheirus salmonis TaxID=72036 RepID=A0A7R8CSR8_LEPSM|nr:glutathione peroxidase 7-like [Lepeophtheirus salmonis]CAB4063226.1 gpx [Lepeophtheirus salmonis]CAF2919391.1 gpx [Lepeophtheirus salmonis]